MSKLVLLDASWLAHKARFAMKGLDFENTPTGIIFGFLEQLRTVCLNPKVSSSRIAVCFDSRQSLRKRAFPFYKEKRATDRTPAEWAEIKVMQEQVKRLRKEILPSIGIPCYRQTGLESDDLMAQASLQLGADQGVIITADGDLWQCITDQVHWYDPSSARNLYLDPGAMQKHSGVSAFDWVDVKCMAGCSTDNVPGIPGVGEKTAVDFIWKLLNPAHKRHIAITSKEGQAIVRRNRKLVELPHPATKPLDLTPPDPGRPVYNADVLFKWGERLGFKSYFESNRRRAWEAFFWGDIGAFDRQVVRKRSK